MLMYRDRDRREVGRKVCIEIEREGGRGKDIMMMMP